MLKNSLKNHCSNSGVDRCKNEVFAGLQFLGCQAEGFNHLCIGSGVLRKYHPSTLEGAGGGACQSVTLLCLALVKCSSPSYHHAPGTASAWWHLFFWDRNWYWWYDQRLCVAASVIKGFGEIWLEFMGHFDILEESFGKWYEAHTSKLPTCRARELGYLYHKSCWSLGKSCWDACPNILRHFQTVLTMGTGLLSILGRKSWAEDANTAAGRLPEELKWSRSES